MRASNSRLEERLTAEKEGRRDTEGEWLAGFLLSNAVISSFRFVVYCFSTVN